MACGKRLLREQWRAETKYVNETQRSLEYQGLQTLRPTGPRLRLLKYFQTVNLSRMGTLYAGFVQVLDAFFLFATSKI